MRLRTAWLTALVLALLSAACSTSEPLTYEDSVKRLSNLMEGMAWIEEYVTRAATVDLGGVDLADTLPPIEGFPIVSSPQPGTQVVAEIFVSTEKSGTGADAWMVEVADNFNRSRPTLADGRSAGVDIRKIASGTGYQFIAAGRNLPDGFSPSNELWVQMAANHQRMTLVSSSLVENTAGLVMKDETAQLIESKYGKLDAASLIEAVIAGDVVMGYTDPFASSTGLNFLVTVLYSFANGEESRMLDPDVASVFETFQQRVPFVALTTMQMRESVEKETGTLDAFVMEWQTFTSTDSLQRGYRFVPFGVRHDNPLYAVGDPDPAKVEVMELLAEFTQNTESRNLAEEFGFDPPAYASDVVVPSGTTLIGAQRLWKDKKEGGRPVSAVFVTDVSGSMEGTRIQAVQRALVSARGFIQSDTRIGMVEFNDMATKRLAIAKFDLNQQARFVAAIEDMEARGGTAMYDGILVGLSMLLEEKAANPETKLMLIVLTDGETRDGYVFSDVSRLIAGLGIPIYTVGFEANLAELEQVSALVEAASINAGEEDVEFKLSALFNAGM